MTDGNLSIRKVESFLLLLMHLHLHFTYTHALDLE